MAQKHRTGPSDFVTGEATFLQNVGWSVQSVFRSFLFSFLLALSIGAVIFFYGANSFDKSRYYSYLIASFQTASWHFNPDHAVGVLMEDGQVKNFNAASIVKSQNIHASVERINDLLVMIGGGCAVLTFVALFCFMWLARRRGRKAKEDIHIRGSEIASPAEVRQALKAKGRLSKIMIGDVPLGVDPMGWLPNILLCGAPGMGKTQILYKILKTVLAEKLGYSVIVYDRKGSFVERFYREERGDVIWNPLDERDSQGRGWSPWAECIEPHHVDEVAAAFIPSAPKGVADPTWTEGARTILSGILRLLQGAQDRTMAKAMHLMILETQKRLADLLGQTMAAGLAEGGSDSKMIRDMRAIMNMYLRPFGFLRAQAGKPGEFSIRRWILGIDDRRKKGAEQPWLFIVCRPDQAEAMAPLVAGALDTIASAVQSLPEDTTRKIMLLADEVDTLPPMKRFTELMNQARDRGVTCIVGLQAFGMWLDTYGRDRARALLSAFRIVAGLGVGEKDTAEALSQMFGVAEVEESKEAIRYAAENSFDAVSLSHERVERPIIHWSEFINLPELEVFVRTRGYPAAKTEIVPEKIPTKAKAFLAAPWESTVAHALIEAAKAKGRKAAADAKKAAAAAKDQKTATQNQDALKQAVSAALVQSLMGSGSVGTAVKDALAAGKVVAAEQKVAPPPAPADTELDGDLVADLFGGAAR